jgi:short-subunit dehydrogenase
VGMRRVSSAIDGSVAIVTGAGKGIGLGISRALARQGVTVVGVGRDEAALAELSQQVGGSYVVADLRDPASADQVVAHTLAGHGRLDIVVANAGLGHFGDVAAMTATRIEDLVSLNVAAPMQLARACLPALRAHGSGRLLFVTSIAGAVGVPGEAVYSATKAAIEMFADVLRVEVRGEGISVGTLVPGVVDTGFFEERGAAYDRSFPRPMPVDRVADAAVSLVLSGRRRQVRPRWLELPIRLRGAAPALYRELERRFG